MKKKPSGKLSSPSLRPEWLSHIAEQVGEAVAVADLKGDILFVNEAWARMHGYGRKDIIGRNLSIFHNARQLKDEVVPFNRNARRLGRWSGLVGHVRRDGTPFQTEMTTTLFRDPQGRPIGILGFARDISDRVRAEQAHAALDRALLMASQYHQAIAQADDGERLLKKICGILVRTGGFRMAWAGVVKPGTKETVRPVASSGAERGYLESITIRLRGPLGLGPTGRALRTGRPATCQDIAADPKYRPWREEAIKRGFASSAAFPLISGSERLGVLNIYSDRIRAFGPQELVLLREMAGDLARAMVALRNRLENRLLMEALPDFYFRLDADGTLLEYRGGRAKRLYAPPSSFIGKNVSRVLPRAAAELILPAISQALGRHRATQLEYSLNIKGQLRHYEARLLPVAARQVVALVRDMTERKLAQEELQLSKERFQALATISPVGIFRTRPDGYTTYVNPQWCRTAGIACAKALGYGWLRRVHPEDRKRIGGGWRKAIRGKSPSSSMYRFLRSDGTVRWVIGHAVPELGPKGQVVGYVGTITDITELKRAEEALRDYQQFHTAIIDRSPLGIAIRESDGRLVSYNRAWERIWSMPDWMIEGMRRKMTQALLRKAYAYVPEHLPGILRVFRSGGTYFIPEIQIKNPRPGQAEWINQYFYAIPDKHGGTDKIVVLVEDITERKRAEQEARMLAEAIRSSSECINITDLEDNILFVNDAFCRTYGYAKSELIGRNISLVIPPGPDHDEIPDIRRLTAAGGWHGELDNLRKDGGRFPVMLSTSVVKDEKGKPLYLIGVTRDITERRRAEAALRDSEARYRQLVRHAPAGIFEFDYRAGKIVDVNDVMCQHTGYSREELLAMNPLEILDDQSRKLHLERLDRARTDGNLPESTEYMIRRKDGSLIWGHFQSRYVFEGGRLARATTVVHDITERKLAEERLAASEEQYRKIYEGIAEGIYRSTPDGRVLMANPALVRLLGYESLDQMLKLDVSQKGYIDHRERQEFMRRIEADGLVRDFLSTWRRLDGTELIVRENARAVRDGQGNILYYEGTVEDITERIQVQRKLEESEEKYRLIFENIAEGIYRTSPDGKVLMANPAMVKMLGYRDLDDLQRINLNTEGYVDPDNRRRFQELMAKNGQVWDFQSRWRRRDGNIIIINENARLVKDVRRNQTYYEGTVEDITEHVQADLALLDEKNKLAQLFDVSLSVARAGAVQEQLDLTIRGLADLGLFKKMAIVLQDDDGRVKDIASSGLPPAEVEKVRRASPLSEADRAALMNQKYRISNSYFIPQDDAEARRLFSFGPASPQQLGDWETADKLLVPLMVKGKLTGYIAVDEPIDGRIPSLEIVRLLELYANQAAIAVENLRLYDDLESSYYDTLRAFVAAMEAKDPYTKGHSENVQRYAVNLARFLGLSDDRIRIIDFSSLLHDIGKLGLKESILNKPAALSDEEYREVKRHPALGSQMVFGIASLASSAPIIQAHHEHYDGRGYPEGRRGDQIPLEARIIAVADAYEAMTSDRPYRRAFTAHEALDRLQAESGKQFDRAMVDAFVKMSGHGRSTNGGIVPDAGL